MVLFSSVAIGASGLRISTPAGQVDVLRLDLAGAGGDQRSLDLVRVGVHADDDVLEVQDDVGDVLLHPGDGRELVGDALDADALDRGASERRQQHAAQAVAERVAEALVEGLDREGAAVVVTFSEEIFGIWNSGRVVIASSALSLFELRALLLRVELDDQLFGDRRGDLAALGQAKYLRGQ